MSAPTKQEERVLFANISALVRQMLQQGARPLQLNMSPDLVRKFEKTIYARMQPKRGDNDKRPWLRLDNAPSIPLMADRALKPMTLVILTDKNVRGGAVVPVEQLILPGLPKNPRVAVVDERVVKEEKAEQTRQSGIWSEVKDRMKNLFK